MSTIALPNEFHVARQGEMIRLDPWLDRLSQADAINLAAWLMALTDFDEVDFRARQILHALSAPE